MRSPTARDAAEGLASHIERTVALARQNGLNKVVLTGTPESWDVVIAALRSAGTEGGETQGAIPEELLCPSGETFTEDEVRDHFRAEVSDAGGVDTWAAAACVSRHRSTDFLVGGPLVSHRLMNAIGFEPVTVYRPITEVGRRALHARTTDGGEA